MSALSFLFVFYLFQFSAKVLELARKQRMNTEVRRNIFCVIMTSEDYLDAFEKLLRFVVNRLCSVSLCSVGWPKQEMWYELFESCFLSKCKFKAFCLLCAKDGPEGQAGERDCSCSDGLLSAGENLQCVLRCAGREILLPRSPLPGKMYTLMTETMRSVHAMNSLSVRQ